MIVEFPTSLEHLRGKPFYEFYIHDVRFSFDEQRSVAVVMLSHTRSLRLDTIDVIFGGVIYHAIMSESYLYMNDEDAWTEEMFLAEAKSSQLIKQVRHYTLLDAVMGDTVSLRHFRVVTQNFFVDIIANEIPRIELE